MALDFTLWIKELLSLFGKKKIIKLDYSVEIMNKSEVDQFD